MCFIYGVSKEKMDSITLTMVILIFLLCLGLYFATAPPVAIPVAAPPPVKVEVRPHPLLAVRPAVLRQNVAVARLLR